MPKVRLSSGTIGTMREPIALSRSSVVRMRTKAMVVEISRPSAVGFNSASKAASGGIASGALARRRAGSEPPSAARRSRRYFISALSSASRTNGILPMSSSETGMWKRSRKRLQRLVADLLLLMGDHLALARLAHAVALDGLGENDGRLALVLRGGLVGGVDLDRIVAAALQRQISSSLQSATIAAVSG